MKKALFSILLLSFLFLSVLAQEDKTFQLTLDSIENSFQYQQGLIDLSNGVAAINVPEGFKFLGSEQSQFVLESLWGNMPDDQVLGMLFPSPMSPLDSTAWAFVVTYEEIGYVKDKDANKIDYDDLLKEMKKDIEAANEQRLSQGYTGVRLIGWASAPFYDQERKALHWAKEFQFGEEQIHTLNYDIRMLGRKGVLSFNAVGYMDQLQLIQPEINKIVENASFNKGYRYSEFNPSIDQVAALTIGGLVAGKVLAKAGFFALLLKFWKLIVVGVAAAGGFIFKLIQKMKKNKEQQMIENL